MLKNKKDVKTVLFALGITAIWVWNWSLPVFEWLPFTLSCFAALSISTMVHNHIHVGIFKSDKMNAIYNYWLTLIYGYPVFAWISTHNKNHHVYNNKPGDFAPPFIVTEKNNLYALLSYPSVSGAVQQKVNFVYLKELWGKDRSKCLYYSSQFLVLFAFYALVFTADWKKALLYVIIPQQIALNMVLVFNFLQHVHCDELSKYNHSRNFVSPFLNFFLFNNGFHTVHHTKPLSHWSELPAMHAEVAQQIDPQLNEPSMLWALVRMYLLAPLFPSLRRRNFRAERLAANVI